jgi:hypothetical protein
MVAPGTHPDRTQGGKMKAIRTHDYRIDGYGNVNFYQNRYRQRTLDLQGFLEARRSRKRSRDWMAKRRAKAFGQARSLFLQKCLFPGRRARMSITTTTRGWSRRKGSNHEIHPFPARRAAQPAFCSPLSGPCRPRKTGTRFFSRAREVSDHRKPPGGYAGAPYHLVATTP